jgi:spermidine/putrescine-binding protein
MKNRRLFALALAIVAVVLNGCGKSAPVLHIYIWDAYLPPAVVDQFTKRTGISVTIDHYGSNEELMAKLASGVTSYDLCVPSDYVVQPLIQQKLLHGLDHARLPHVSNLTPRFVNQAFDPGNQYTMPYLWGTTGLAYNKKLVNPAPDSWNVLFDPAYKGKILMLDDKRECFVVALKLMGKSVNETDPATLRAAADMLKKQHDLVRTYDSTNYDNTLLSKDVVVAHGWNGQMAKVVSDHPDDYAYILPKEGGDIWLDNIAIPAGAQNVDAAYQFIDYVLEGETAAQIVNGVNYASPNEAAKAHIDPKILNDPNIYPPDSALKNWEYLNALGGATDRMISDLWTEIKAK